jgi:hypothetical protein
MMITSSRLSKVSSVHRFIAAFFGLSLLLFPSPQYELMSVGKMPWQDRIVTQAWGCTIIMVALVVHESISFSVVAFQRSVAWSLVACFAVETVLYLHAGFLGGAAAANMPQGTVVGIQVLVPVFAGLLVAYSWALLEPPAPLQSSVSSKTPADAAGAATNGRLALVFRVHRWVALGAAAVSVLVPSALYWPFPGAEQYATLGSPGELFAIQSWGAFLFAAAGIVQGALQFDSQAQRAVGRAMLLQLVLLSALFLNGLVVVGELDDLYTYGGLPVFLPMTVFYGWALMDDDSVGASSRDKKE